MPGLRDRASLKATARFVGWTNADKHEPMAIRKQKSRKKAKAKVVNKKYRDIKKCNETLEVQDVQEVQEVQDEKVETNKKKLREPELEKESVKTNNLKKKKAQTQTKKKFDMNKKP